MKRGKAASANKSILGESEFKNGKLDSSLNPLAQPPKCPECASQKVWKDGLRCTKQGEVQRYLCRDCGYRFSKHKIKVNITSEFPKTSHSRENVSNSGIGSFDLSRKEKLNGFSLPSSENVSSHGSSSTVTSVAKPLKALPYYSSKRQVCVSEREAKNLSQQSTRQKRAAGATKAKTAEVKGKIIEYLWYLKKQAYAESTVKMRTRVLEQLANEGANLFDPESVKQTIAAHDTWSEGYKLTLVNAYDKFAEMLGIRWEPPNYRRVRELPFIPLEKEIDTLIAGCGRKVAASLQIMKETGMRIGEVWQLRWIDIDEERRTIKCRSEKHGNPRMFKISGKLIAILNMLPKTSEKVFGGTSLNGHRWNFTKQKRRLALKLQNPRLEQITFHTFRHWKATMEYHKTKDILHVKQLLGHRNINSTLIYTQLVNFESDEFHVRTAKTLEEACELAKAGFDYFTEVDGVQIFRKRK